MPVRGSIRGPGGDSDPAGPALVTDACGVAAVGVLLEVAGAVGAALRDREAHTRTSVLGLFRTSDAGRTRAARLLRLLLCGSRRVHAALRGSCGKWERFFWYIFLGT